MKLNIFILLLFCTCTADQNFNPIEPDTTLRAPITLEEATNHSDSIYVLDYYFYENGKIKPPCSISPDYEGCILSRAKQLKIEDFKF